MISRDKRQRRKVRLVTVVAGAMVLWAAVASSVAAQDADDPGRLTVTGPEPQGITWTVLSRFGGDSNGDGRIDGLEEGVPEHLDVFPVLMEAPREACDLAGDATWSVDGHAQAPRRDPEPHNMIRSCAVATPQRRAGVSKGSSSSANGQLNAPWKMLPAVMPSVFSKSTVVLASMHSRPDESSMSTS